MNMYSVGNELTRSERLRLSCDYMNSECDTDKHSLL